MVVVLQVAKMARDKWMEIGRYLGFKMEELTDYEEKEPKSMQKRLLRLLVDWRKKEKDPSVGALISACEKADVGGEAERVIFGVKD